MNERWRIRIKACADPDDAFRLVTAGRSSAGRRERGERRYSNAELRHGDYALQFGARCLSLSQATAPFAFPQSPWSRDLAGLCRLRYLPGQLEEIRREAIDRHPALAVAHSEVRRSEARLQYEKSFRGPQPALRGEVDMTNHASNCAKPRFQPAMMTLQLRCRRSTRSLTTVRWGMKSQWTWDFPSRSPSEQVK